MAGDSVYFTCAGSSHLYFSRYLAQGLVVTKQAKPLTANGLAFLSTACIVENKFPHILPCQGRDRNATHETDVAREAPPQNHPEPDFSRQRTANGPRSYLFRFLEVSLLCVAFQLSPHHLQRAPSDEKSSDAKVGSTEDNGATYEKTTRDEAGEHPDRTRQPRSKSAEAEEGEWRQR